MSVRGQPIYDKKYWKKIEQKFNTAEYQELSHLSILKILWKNIIFGKYF